MSELYLECALRDGLGVSDGLFKKVRREVCEKGGFEVQRMVISGRDHVVLDRALVDAVLGGLSAKKPRGGSIELSAGSVSELLRKAVVQGVPFEEEGVLHSDEITLMVRQVTRNRFVMLAEVETSTDCTDSEDLPNNENQADELVRLRVKDSGRYAPGMVVKGCRKIGDGIYEYAGREPRSRGRW